jgi:hypothetical protein
MRDAEMSWRTGVSLVILAAAFYFLFFYTSVAIEMIALYLTGMLYL